MTLQEYQELKKKKPESLILFRMGMFYEAFEEDAQIMSKLLGLTLTRHEDMKMAGFHAFDLEKNLRKILDAKHNVRMV